LPEVEDFGNVEGLGVQGIVDGHAVLVGRTQLLEEWSQYLPDDLAHAKDHAEAEGSTAVAVGWDGQARAVLVVADTVKATSSEAIVQLKSLGLRPVLLTGDNEAVASKVAAEVGIDEVIAEVLPADKAAVVRRLQEDGRVVAMVGDGVNDAPALARADVGIAIGAGTDVAIESAGIVLVSNDPRGVVSVIRLSVAAYRKMVQNLAWAAGYNVLAIPLAAGALEWAGVTLPPAVAAVLMSLSTIVVAANAQLLRRLDLRP
jgi:Cu+-exporting ATPase